ncbi:MAG: hypothetical protein EHM70_15165 [Chloroflexota bacterium]|nr:MAG: hypothetical protein EHM70_15165 [Chloroflexota bacterium]
MRQLMIDMSELELAFEHDDVMASYYLDTETGEIIFVTQESQDHLESINETYYDGETEAVDWETAFIEENLRDWQRESIRDASRVQEGFGSRIIKIPTQDSREGYRDMERFIATVNDPRLRDRLDRAISGRGAFRYFNDVLRDYPAERERWFEFKKNQVYVRMRDWLESEDISPLE